MLKKHFMSIILEEEPLNVESQPQYKNDYNSYPSSYSNSDYYDDGYTTNRKDDFSHNSEKDPIHDRPSESKNGFTNFPHQNRNSISISTSKGFDQELSILKDVDPLARLHAIARGETVEEKKTTNSRYEENSLSDKSQQSHKRIDRYKTSPTSSDQSSISSDFTSFGRRKKSRKPSWTTGVEKNSRKYRNKVPSLKTNPHRRRKQSHNTAKALSNFLKSKQRHQDLDQYQQKETEYYDHQPDHYDVEYHNDYDHDHEEGNYEFKVEVKKRVT